MKKLLSWLYPRPNQPERRDAPAPAADGLPPLVLLVEDPDGPRELSALIATSGCRTFTVRDHAELLAWGPLLPCSALLLDIAMPDARLSIMRKLRGLVDHRLISDIPVWAAAAELDLAAHRNWLQAGVEEILLLPPQPVIIRRTCNRLPPPPVLFYRAYDQSLRDELPSGATLRLPEMNAELAARLLALHNDLDRLATAAPALAPPAFHAIKSIALSLGYFRLAALMSAIEEAVALQSFRAAPANWHIIRDYLCPGDCSFPITVIPPGITDNGMTAVKGYRL